MKKTVQTSDAKSVPFFACFQSLSIEFSTNRQQKQASRYCLLYHYEKIQGTTTRRLDCRRNCTLYHYEKIQGTTTYRHGILQTGRYTTTRKYRELQPDWGVMMRRCVISLRENTGNYNDFVGWIKQFFVIPLRENTGNCCKLLSLSTI